MVDVQKLQKLARIIVNYSISVKKGEKILLRGYGFDSYPLVKEIYREAVKAGASKIDVRFSRSELSRIFYQHASQEQIAYLDPLDKKIAQNFDSMVQIVADENPYELSGVDVKKLQMSHKVMKPVSDILHKKKWCLFYYPNVSSAQTAKKSIEEWEDFVMESSMKDWKKEEKMQEKFVQLMSKVKKIQIVGRETDLQLSVKGQKWLKCCGTHNLPDGEIFTSPVRKSVNGVIRYNVPTRYQGKDFDWVKLWLKDGKVVKEECSHDVKDLRGILSADVGARYFGEFAFGLNNSITEPTRQIIFDEKMGKSLHMALGKCYDDAPNGNDSTVHWDLIFKFQPANAEIFFDDVKVYSKTRWIDHRFLFLN